jgi:hypothetical protein
VKLLSTLWTAVEHGAELVAGCMVSLCPRPHCGQLLPRACYGSIESEEEAPAGHSDRRQHAGEHLQAQVLLVPQPVRPALDDADLVVQPLDEPQRHLVLLAAVGCNPVPVALDHGGELLVGLEPLPLQRRFPVLEKASRPALALVVPQLAEGLLEHVGRVEPLVGGQQLL